MIEVHENRRSSSAPFWGDARQRLRVKLSIQVMRSLALLPFLLGIAGAQKKLEIRPNPDAEWNAQPADVRAVFDSVAGEFAPLFPGIEIDPILVEPKGGPIVLFQRGPNNEHQVRLSTGGRLWAQYSFQFSHELCHIYCRYDRDEHPNKWFEESICELASLFVLRRMGETWKTKPPYGNWKSYAGALTSYAQDRIDGVALQRSRPFLPWFERERASLAKDSGQRQKNTVIASMLLELFEAQPQNWAAVHYLNVSAGTPEQNFEKYLLEWRNNAPYRHHEFIEKIASRFGVRLAE